MDIPEPGLYTLSAFGLKGAGQSWTADSCLKAVVCADPDTQVDVPEWRPVLTAQFAAGRHAFSVLLAPGAVIQRVRVERKKETPADYVATLRRLGFDVGPPGPMPRDRAVDAMRFLEKKAAPMKEARCGDVVLPMEVAGTRAGLEVAQIDGPAQPGPESPERVPPPLGGGPLVPLPGPEPPIGGAVAESDAQRARHALRPRRRALRRAPRRPRRAAPPPDRRPRPCPRRTTPRPSCRYRRARARRRSGCVRRA